MCRHDEIDGPWLGLALSMHFVGRLLVVVECLGLALLPLSFSWRLLEVEGECRSLSLLAKALSWLLLEVDGEWRSLALLEVDGAP